ncbi:hypothetical protein D3C81_1436860 [compost metagenome]
MRQRLLDPAPGLMGVGDQRGRQGVLGTGAKAAQQQREQQHAQATGLPDNQVSQPGQGGAAH